MARSGSVSARIAQSVRALRSGCEDGVVSVVVLVSFRCGVGFDGGGGVGSWRGTVVVVVVVWGSDENMTRLRSEGGHVEVNGLEKSGVSVESALAIRVSIQSSESKSENRKAAEWGSNGGNWNPGSAGPDPT